MRDRRSSRSSVTAMVAVMGALLVVMSGCAELGVEVSAEEDGNGGGPSSQYESPNIGTMRLVPAGTYQRDQTPTNITEVSAFYMSRHTITQAQYEAVTGKANPSSFSSGEDAPNRPVETVSWYDALVFSNMLSLAEGRTPVYTIDGSTDPADWGEVPTGPNETWNAAIMNADANGYRLPTEAEWLWAAMGATLDARDGAFDESGVNRTGYTKGYAGSSEDGISNENVGDYAWYTDNSGGTTQPVGRKLPNELGLYDMSGNVWEWTWDNFGSYDPGTLIDPTGPISGTMRSLRGGVWNASASMSSFSARSGTNPSNRSNTNGLRVVFR